MINVYQPTLGKEELDALQEVFESNWLGKGKRVAEFEEKYAGHLGTSKDLVLTTNCCSEGLFSSMHLLIFSQETRLLFLLSASLVLATQFALMVQNSCSATLTLAL